MTNFIDIEQINDLNQLCKSLGFIYERSGRDYSRATLNLMPTDELVIYNTTMALYCGNVEDIIHFLRGWQFAHQYLNVLGATSAKIIDRKKLDYRNKKLAHMIKHGKEEKCES